MLALSGIARSTYYYYLKQKDKDKYEGEKQEILEIYALHSGRYGYRRICAALKGKGHTINHKTVLKLMKDNRGKGVSKSGKTKGRPPKLDPKAEEDLIAENRRLRMEIEYLKKLSALVLAEERKNGKKQK